MTTFLRTSSGKMINVSHITSIAHVKDKGVQVVYFDGVHRTSETVYKKLGADYVGLASDLAVAASSEKGGVIAVNKDGKVASISGEGASPRALNIKRFPAPNEQVEVASA